MYIYIYIWGDHIFICLSFSGGGGSPPKRHTQLIFGTWPPTSETGLPKPRLMSRVARLGGSGGKAIYDQLYAWHGEKTWRLFWADPPGENLRTEPPKNYKKLKKKNMIQERWSASALGVDRYSSKGPRPWPWAFPFPVWWLDCATQLGGFPSWSSHVKDLFDQHPKGWLKTVWSSLSPSNLHASGLWTRVAHLQLAKWTLRSFRSAEPDIHDLANCSWYQLSFARDACVHVSHANRHPVASHVSPLVSSDSFPGFSSEKNTRPRKFLQGTHSRTCQALFLNSWTRL